MYFRKFMLTVAVLMTAAVVLFAQEKKDGTYSGVRIPAKEDGSLKFAVMSDVHISVGTPSEQGTLDCVEDINKDPEIQFVLITGDIANFGSDDEIASAKKILDQLKMPWFIIPGNHDATWSESGTNSFTRIFGYERFEFEAGGIKFLGTPCGPNIRMAPALVPRESMLWLEEQIGKMPEAQPLFYVNHYPLDTSLLKYDNVLELLKTKNIQLVFSGHWHVDRAMEYEGVPGVIIRSTLATAKGDKGYVIAELKGSLITFQDKIVGKKEPGKVWYTVRLSQGKAYPDNIVYEHPKNDFNVRFPQVKEVWRYENNADIGSGAAIWRKKGMVVPGAGFNALPSVSGGVQEGDIVIFADEAGMIYGLDAVNGKKKWEFKTEGKIFSTPAVSGEYVVVGSSDNNIYCLNPENGKLRWKLACGKSVLGSANILKETAYIGASDGIFRAINLKTGKLMWSYKKMKGFVVSRPYVDKDQVVIGDWGNTLYSFDPKSGHLQWSWTTPKSVRNFSPAQVWPVKSRGKIFIVNPDRISYVIDAEYGITLSTIYGGREAIGLSPDKGEYYIKCMKDTVRAYSIAKIDSALDGASISDGKAIVLDPKEMAAWQTITEYKYEIAPSPITVKENAGKDGKGLLFISTDKGNVFALNCSDGSVAWQHNVAGALVNYALPVGNRQLLVSTMDGVIALLEY
ncbi:MAG: PQQ-binding-like beta-propeller repeat protein [Bacteroidales bacterium]|nr:PQQ-binding-like beta-propeller repeat protein [Bacteroidales bacterium]